MHAISISKHSDTSLLKIILNMTVSYFPLNKSTHAAVTHAVCNGNIIFPAYEDAVRIAHRAGFGSSLVAAPPVDVVQAFEGNKNGKFGTYPWMKKNGMEDLTIRTYAPSRTQFNNSQVQYPVIVKPFNGGGGRNVYVARNGRDLSKIRKHMRHERIIIEEAIENKNEWALHFSAYRGKMTSTICIRFQFSHPFGIRKTKTTDAVNTTRIRICPSTILSATDAIINKSLYHGVGCLSGKFKADQFKIVDINPRVCNMAAKYDRDGTFMKTFLELIRKEPKAAETPNCSASRH